ncbi:hypothetical protein PQX77_000936 [Marasmius sp. AFHP31]|nr:hypothetical protein PQX77_000936 [Marasmius sp. AFHP31]
MHGYDWPSANKLITMLRYSPSLENVELSFTKVLVDMSKKVSDYQLFPFLETFPGLKYFNLTLAMSERHTLEFRRCYIDKMILHLMHKLQPDSQQSTAAFLPMLQSLRLNISDLGLEMQEKAFEMASSMPGLKDCKIVREQSLDGLWSSPDPACRKGSNDG